MEQPNPLDAQLMDNTHPILQTQRLHSHRPLFEHSSPLSTQLLDAVEHEQSSRSHPISHLQ
ncbi:hypothetical protein NPN19_24605, partial [Vibrio parahaemolyticus]|uniref:hypothetical protein n=1 Tax=Vibrio parahaemolyticus TaxID=670 RepID=UPI0021129EE5